MRTIVANSKIVEEGLVRSSIGIQGNFRIDARDSCDVVRREVDLFLVLARNDAG